MTEKEKTLLLFWVVNEQERLDQEYIDTLQSMDYRAAEPLPGRKRERAPAGRPAFDLEVFV